MTLPTTITRLYKLLFKKDPYNRHHAELRWINGKLTFHWTHHDDYTLIKQAHLEHLQKELTPAEFILTALHEAKHCNFIVFTCGDEELFVQFWLDNGELMGSWPVFLKKHKRNKYTYAMLGLLNELNVNQKLRRVGNTFSSQYIYYECATFEEYDDYQIHFAHNYQDAQTFVIKAFTEIFKQDLKKLRIELG